MNHAITVTRIFLPEKKTVLRKEENRNAAQMVMSTLKKWKKHLLSSKILPEKFIKDLVNAKDEKLREEFLSTTVPLNNTFAFASIRHGDPCPEDQMGYGLTHANIMVVLLIVYINMTCKLHYKNLFRRVFVFVQRPCDPTRTKANFCSDILFESRWRFKDANGRFELQNETWDQAPNYRHIGEGHAQEPIRTDIYHNRRNDRKSKNGKWRRNATFSSS